MKKYLMIDPDRTTLNKQPVIQAVMTGNDELVEHQLNLGMAVDAMDADGRTALMYAAGNGRTSMARILLNHGANAREVGKSSVLTPIVCAVHFAVEVDGGDLRLYSNGDAELVALLMRYGADANYADELGNSVLKYSILGKRKDIVRFLLDEHVVVNTQSAGGATPLMTAVHSGDAEIVEMLLLAGADVKLRMKNGRTALDIAKIVQNSEMIDLLSRAETKQQ